MKTGGAKLYIKNSVTSDPAQGDTGYYAEYLTEDYEFAVIDYGSGNVNILIPEDIQNVGRGNGRENR